MKKIYGALCVCMGFFIGDAYASREGDLQGEVAGAQKEVSALEAQSHAIFKLERTTRRAKLSAHAGAKKRADDMKRQLKLAQEAVAHTTKNLDDYRARKNRKAAAKDTSKHHPAGDRGAGHVPAAPKAPPMPSTPPKAPPMTPGGMPPPPPPMPGGSASASPTKAVPIKYAPEDQGANHQIDFARKFAEDPKIKIGAGKNIQLELNNNKAYHEAWAGQIAVSLSQVKAFKKSHQATLAERLDVTSLRDLNNLLRSFKTRHIAAHLKDVDVPGVIKLLKEAIKTSDAKAKARSAAEEAKIGTFVNHLLQHGKIDGNPLTKIQKKVLTAQAKFIEAEKSKPALEEFREEVKEILDNNVDHLQEFLNLNHAISAQHEGLMRYFSGLWITIKDDYKTVGAFNVDMRQGQIGQRRPVGKFTAV